MCIVNTKYVKKTVLSKLEGAFKLTRLETVRRSSIQSRCLTIEKFRIKGSVSAVSSSSVIVLTIPPSRFRGSIRGGPTLLARYNPIVSIVTNIAVSLLDGVLERTHLIESVPGAPSRIRRKVALCCIHSSASTRLVSVSRDVFNSVNRYTRITSRGRVSSTATFTKNNPTLITCFTGTLRVCTRRRKFSDRTTHTVAVRLLCKATLLLQTAKGASVRMYGRIRAPSKAARQTVRLLSSRGLGGDVFTTLATTTRHSTRLKHDLRRERSCSCKATEPGRKYSEWFIFWQI